jgi:hypothetical protein
MHMLHLLSFCLTPPYPQNQSTPIIHLDSSTSSLTPGAMETSGGSDHPQWSHSYQREAPSGGHHTSKDDQSQGSSLPSTVVDSDYEDSDSRRKRSRQERRDRHEMNMNRPDNTMYRAIKEDQKKRKAERKKNRQEERFSKRVRGGNRGGGGKGPTSTSTGSTTVSK